MNPTLINAASLEAGKIYARKLFSEYRVAESYEQLGEIDLFDADKPCLFLNRAPTANLNLFKHVQKLVIVTENLSSNHPLIAWVQKEGIVVDLTKEALWQKDKRLEAEVRKKATSIEPEALKMLLKIPEERLANELEKLITHNPHITLKAVELLVPAVVNSLVWPFLDNILQKDSKKAINTTLGGIDAFFGILRLVRNQHKNLLLFKQAGPHEKREVLSTLKERSFQSIQAASPHFTVKELEEGLIKLDRLGFMMRDGLTDETLVHTLIVAYTC